MSKEKDDLGDIPKVCCGSITRIFVQSAVELKVYLRGFFRSKDKQILKIILISQRINWYPVQLSLFRRQTGHPPVIFSVGGNTCPGLTGGIQGKQSNIHGQEHYPVVHIAIEDAQAYAKRKGHRLPTEAEFEYAARTGLINSRYAWGEQRIPDGKHQANTWQGFFPMQSSAEDGYTGRVLSR